MSMRTALTLLSVCIGCAGGEDTDRSPGTPAPPAAAGTPTTAAQSGAAISLSDADLDGFERGLAAEIEAVRAARALADTARTPEARGAAAQAGWETATIPLGAAGAGMPEARYREVRTAVHQVLQDLDFQGKIDGPISMDTTRATPEMRLRLTRDPYAALTPASADLLRSRLDRIVPVWITYVNLTAVSG
jgi:hypothetical protein